MKLPINNYKFNHASADSGNINWSKLLQPTEIWTHPSEAMVSANGLNVVDMSSVTVAVQPAAVAKVSCGQQSKTAMPWYRIFPVGAESSLAGLEVFKTKRDMTKFESAQANISSFIIMGFGCMVLWFGLICFAVNTFASIGAGTKNTDSSSVSAPTTLNIELLESK